jgi:hypothetical protein
MWRFQPHLVLSFLWLSYHMARADRFQAISSAMSAAVTQRVPQAAQTGDPTQLGLTPLGQIPNDPLGIAVYRTSGNRGSF